MPTSISRTKVVYLFGAGASHGCVKAVGSPHGILMRDLGIELSARLRALVDTGGSYYGNFTLTNLVEHLDR